MRGATGRVLEYVAGRFVSAGWNVSVLVIGNANDVFDAKNGVRVNTVGIETLPKHSIIFRGLNTALSIPKLFIRAIAIPRADVVVTMTDPPMLKIIGGILGYFKKSRTIHWSQDLYPEVAEVVGVLKPGGVIADTLRAISTFAIRCHDMVVVPGRCMEKRLGLRGLSTSRIRVIPNRGSERGIRSLPRFPNKFRKILGFGDSYVVEYSGNMGLAHEFNTIIEAAELLKSSGEKGIIFLFVGGGPREASVKEAVCRKGLNNVHFLPAQPEDQLSEILGTADLHLVTMMEGMSGLVVPSKIYGVMAASRPCLFIGPEDSEAALEILGSRVGTVVRPGDVNALVCKILEYRDAGVTFWKELKPVNAVVPTDDEVSLFVNMALKLCYEGNRNQT